MLNFLECTYGFFLVRMLILKERNTYQKTRQFMYYINMYEKNINITRKTAIFSGIKHICFVK